MKKGRRNFSSKSKGKFFDKKLAFFVVVVAIVAIAIVAVNVNKKEDVGLSPTSYSNCQKITINPSGLVACYSYALLSHRFLIYPYQDGTYLAKSYNSDKKIIESFTCTATTSNGGRCSSPVDSIAVQITWGSYTECLEKGKTPVKGTLGSDGKCVGLLTLSSLNDVEIVGEGTYEGYFISPSNYHLYAQNVELFSLGTIGNVFGDYEYIPSPFPNQRGNLEYNRETTFNNKPLMFSIIHDYVYPDASITLNYDSKTSRVYIPSTGKYSLCTTHLYVKSNGNTYYAAENVGSFTNDNEKYCVGSGSSRIISDLSRPAAVCEDLDSDGRFGSTSINCPISITDCDDNNPLRADNKLEICDGIDNNCDNIVDNMPGTCSAGVGAYLRSGTYSCSGTNKVCSAVAGTPGTEVCGNNRCDEDCNGADTCPISRST